MPVLGKSLYEVVKMNDFKPFLLDHVRDFARQLLDGLDFLRGMRLIHTDLKPENILLVKSDFHTEVRDGKPYHIPRDTRIRSTFTIRCSVQVVFTLRLTLPVTQLSILEALHMTTSGRVPSLIRGNIGDQK